MSDFKPLEWRNNRLILLDQTRLPAEEVYTEITDYRRVVEDIKRLAVRGAPAIGIAAAFGMALGALEYRSLSQASFVVKMKEVKEVLWESRPTARNLFWALERMQSITESGASVKETVEALVEEAGRILGEQLEADLSLSRLGAGLLKPGDTVLTHCNAGALATGGFGTALGVIKQAFSEGKNIRAFATETRPLLQGARLTAFELKKSGIPFTLITDSMAGYFMRKGQIQAVITGADRIAANGDTANKIGTFSLAVLAKEHGIPFHIAAPLSTIDKNTSCGAEIVIEERAGDEVTSIKGIRIAPEGVSAANPAFDVTPYQYISAIITEKKLLYQPYAAAIADLDFQRST